MTFQALVAILVSLPRQRVRRDTVDASGLPLWEKPLVEQRHERDRIREQSRLWLRIPRGL